MIARGDGLIWQCGDFQSDGTHPSNSGRLKVAQLLLNFFRTDPTAQVWFLRSPPTGIERADDQVPGRFVLEQNFPNPFNPTTTIHFSLPQREQVTLKIFDVLGQEVATLVKSEYLAGNHSVVFYAEDLASGIYFYRLDVGANVQQRAMVLQK
ncbi:MAG: T9SS type A sorting domain-containing protein, partial [Bacteroidota bacterium]